MSSPWPAVGVSAGTVADGGGDCGHDPHLASDRLPEPARRALVSLLLHRYISRARHRVAWEGILTSENDLRARLDEMYLDLVVDHEAEVAFKRQQESDDIPRVLRRERALSRDASLVLIFLRREYAYADPDDGPVVVTRDQIAEFLRPYREDGDSDGARFSRRVDAAVSALVKPWQILEPDPAVGYLFTVSPVVVPLVGPDEMHRLETAFRRAADAVGECETDDAASGSAEDAGDGGEGDLP